MTPKRSISLGRAANRPGEYEKQLGKSLRTVLEKALKTAARQSIPVLIARTLDAPPASDSPRSKIGAYASGKMAQGWVVDYAYGKKGGSWSLEATIYNKELYMPFQNDGVKALGAAMRPRRTVRVMKKAKNRMALQQMIELWIIQRGIVSIYGESVPKLATRIIRAMYRRKPWTLKPRTMIERASARTRQIFDLRVRDAFLKAAEDIP